MSGPFGYNPGGGGGTASSVTVSNLPATQPVSGTVAAAGSVGADATTNAMPIPLSGYVLVATLAPNPTRNTWSIYNFSGAQVQYVFDDGSATAGTVSAALLQGGSGSPSQGGSDSGQGFTGRIRAYAPSSTALVTLRQT